MYKTFYAAQLDAIFIKIYDYNGAVIARACVDVMQGMFRTQIDAPPDYIVEYASWKSNVDWLRDGAENCVSPLFNLVSVGLD